MGTKKAKNKRYDLWIYVKSIYDSTIQFKSLIAERLSSKFTLRNR